MLGNTTANLWTGLVHVEVLLAALSASSFLFPAVAVVSEAGPHLIDDFVRVRFRTRQVLCPVYYLLDFDIDQWYLLPVFRNLGEVLHAYKKFLLAAL